MRAPGDHGFEDDDIDEQEHEPTGPQVVWTLGLDDAEELHHYLHHNRPGGYQAVHDSLLDAIAQTRLGAPNAP